jgi:putative ABC transport system permease protein
MTVSLSLPRAKYANAIQETDFYQRLMDRLRTIPGIHAVGAINTLPFGKTVTIGLLFDVVGQPYTGKVEDRFASNLVVTSDYFKAMGIPLLQGRFFTEQDTKESPKVVIISESLARRYWSGESPLGKKLTIAAESRPSEVIAVVGDVKHFGLESKYSQAMYIPYLQTTSSLTTLVLRMNSEPSAIVGAIRNEVKALDSDLPVYDINTMDQWLDESMAQRRFITFALGIFALVALTLAVSGIYSIVAYTVSQRRREIGIRMALGAQRGHILKLILRNGLSLTVAGAIIGLASAVALTRLMSSLLYNLQPIDPLIFALTALGLIAVALLASFIPAYESTRVDPMIALRNE